MSCLTQRNPVCYVSVGIQQVSAAATVAAWTTKCVFWLSRTWPAVRCGSSSLSLLLRDFHLASPPEHVDSWSVPPIVAPPLAPCLPIQICHLCPHLDVDCVPLQPVMIVPSRPSAEAKFGTRIGRPRHCPLAVVRQIAGTTITPLCSTSRCVCIASCRVSWLSGHWCAPSCPPPSLTPRGLMSAHVESCWPQ